MSLRLKCVNLEASLPSVIQARARLLSELEEARRAGFHILKVIHGYGSTGVGGDLRISLQSTLRQMLERHEIRNCIYGEDWRKSNDCAWELVKRYPELKDETDFGRGNRGITIVVL
jgi:hypothetical protein